VNIRFVIRQLGVLMIVLSLSILAAAAWSGLEYELGETGEAAAAMPLLITVVAGLILALALRWIGRGCNDFLGRREALLLVALSWLGGAALSALPYWLWATAWASSFLGSTDTVVTSAVQTHPFSSFVSCYFEAMSGLTTTGATVLSDIESLPRGLLLWRSLTHWLGGLGIVVLFVAVLPSLGVGGKKLFQVEAPGPTSQGVRPRIRETARMLWLIYLGLTAAEIVALRVLGMDWFDAVCHTFATLATGGFSTRNASAGAYDSVAIDVTIIFFMVLAGANFGIYYQLIRRRFRSVWKDPELRLYLGILTVASVIVVVSLLNTSIVSTTGDVHEPSVGQALRYGVFQVVSIQTTTGFCTADFEHWGFVAKAVLIALMFVGASAGSTGGGIKVIRCLIAVKVMLAEVERVFRPNVVRTVKVGRMPVEPEMRLATLVYVLGVLVLFLTGAIILMVLEPSGQITFTTAATASAATLNNVGPGLDLVGALENYGWFSAPSKIVLSILMVLGRLEVYAIFVLFMPRFWRVE